MKNTPNACEEIVAIYETFGPSISSIAIQLEFLKYTFLLKCVVLIHHTCYLTSRSEERSTCIEGSK